MSSRTISFIRPQMLLVTLAVTLAVPQLVRAQVLLPPPFANRLPLPAGLFPEHRGHLPAVLSPETTMVGPGTSESESRSPGTTGGALGEITSAETVSAESSATLVEAVPPLGDDDGTGWAAVPFMYVQPETSAAFGAAVIYYFDTTGGEPGARLSDLRGVATYTLRRQWSLNFHPHIYFGGGRHYWDLKVQYKDFPDRFWGIGPVTRSDHEVFSSRALLLRSEFVSEVLPHFYLGPVVELESNRIDELESDGLLAPGDILGSDGGFINGLGVKIAYDTRDGTYFAHTGWDIQFSLRTFHAIFGSDFNFTRINLDARRYIPTWRQQVLALQLYSDVNLGDTPFYRLGMFGGSHLFRGYWEGRFRDNNVVMFQTDYRIPIWGPIGADVFFNVGEVFASASDLSFGDIDFTGGGGARYAINDDRLNIRLDFGAGPAAWGVYLNVGEAF